MTAVPGLKLKYKKNITIAKVATFAPITSLQTETITLKDSTINTYHNNVSYGSEAIYILKETTAGSGKQYRMERLDTNYYKLTKNSNYAGAFTLTFSTLDALLSDEERFHLQSVYSQMLVSGSVDSTLPLTLAVDSFVNNAGLTITYRVKNIGTGFEIYRTNLITPIITLGTNFEGDISKHSFANTDVANVRAAVQDCIALGTEQIVENPVETQTEQKYNSIANNNIRRYKVDRVIVGTYTMNRQEQYKITAKPEISLIVDLDPDEITIFEDLFDLTTTDTWGIQESGVNVYGLPIDSYIPTTYKVRDVISIKPLTSQEVVQPVDLYKKAKGSDNSLSLQIRKNAGAFVIERQLIKYARNNDGSPNYTRLEIEVNLPIYDDTSSNQRGVISIYIDDAAFALTKSNVDPKTGANKINYLPPKSQWSPSTQGGKMSYSIEIRNNEDHGVIITPPDVLNGIVAGNTVIVAYYPAYWGPQDKNLPVPKQEGVDNSIKLGIPFFGGTITGDTRKLEVIYNPTDIEKVSNKTMEEYDLYEIDFTALLKNDKNNKMGLALQLLNFSGDPRKTIQHTRGIETGEDLYNSYYVNTWGLSPQKLVMAGVVERDYIQARDTNKDPIFCPMTRTHYVGGNASGAPIEEKLNLKDALFYLQKLNSLPQRARMLDEFSIIDQNLTKEYFVSMGPIKFDASTDKQNLYIFNMEFDLIETIELDGKRMVVPVQDRKYITMTYPPQTKTTTVDKGSTSPTNKGIDTSTQTPTQKVPSVSKKDYDVYLKVYAGINSLSFNVPAFYTVFNVANTSLPMKITNKTVYMNDVNVGKKLQWFKTSSNFILVQVNWLTTDFWRTNQSPLKIEVGLTTDTNLRNNGGIILPATFDFYSTIIFKAASTVKSNVAQPVAQKIVPSSNIGPFFHKSVPNSTAFTAANWSTMPAIELKHLDTKTVTGIQLGSSPEAQWFKIDL